MQCGIISSLKTLHPRLIGPLVHSNNLITIRSFTRIEAASQSGKSNLDKVNASNNKSKFSKKFHIAKILLFPAVFIMKCKYIVVQCIAMLTNKEKFNIFMSEQLSMRNKSVRANIIVSIYFLFYFIYTNLRKPLVLFQLSSLILGFGFLRRYAVYTKSLTQEISYGAFLKILKEAPERFGVVKATQNILAYTLDGKRSITRIVNIERGLLSELVNSGVDIIASVPPTNVLGLIWSGAYLFILWNIYSKAMQGPRDENVGVSKDKLKLDRKLSFDDIAGQDKAKVEVKEVCDMLKSPSLYASAGARLPSGVLLTGPPGTGKTLLARVTATEANVPFIACSGTDFVEVFVGRGPARIRKLFKQSAAQAPCIIFIDEIDSIGRSRRSFSMNSEQESTLNQLLTCMDGLDTSNNGVIVIAATNRAELLDPALLRPGRFDRLVQCPLPDRDGRLAILKVHARKLIVDGTVNLETVASATSGLCGADLANIVNEAAIRAVRRRASVVTQQDFFEAIKSFFDARGLSMTLGDWANWNPLGWVGKSAGLA